MDSDTDLNYYPAQPPRMTDPRYFPPSESQHGLIGVADLQLDDVIDPDFPWQLLPHDSPGGQKRVDEIKRQKAAEVAGYHLRHSRVWKQFMQPKFVPSPLVETISFTVGRTRKQKTTVEQGIEVSLGLKKGIFEAGVKGSLKWNREMEESFSESETRTSEQHYEAECWYIYWQTLDILTLYRRTKDSPDVFVEISVAEAPSGLIMVDKYQRSDLGAVPEALLGAGKVTLHKGESHTFGGWVFADTKVMVKNPSSNDDGELTVVWLGIGKKVIVKVPPGKTKTHSQYVPAGFRAINSGVTDLDVWNDT
ncbi:MAG: hypothetical protein R6U27_01580 [Desulfobacterales bacterium]